jgi:hypothetical protein
LREGERRAADAISRGEEPAGGALLDGMEAIAGDALRHLDHQRVGVVL